MFQLLLAMYCDNLCLITFSYFVFSDHGNDVQVPQGKLEFLSAEATQVWNTDFIINKIMWLGCRYDGVIDRASGFLLEDHRLMTWPCYCMFFFIRKETSVHAIPLHLEPSGPNPDLTNPWLVETFNTVFLQVHNDFHKILVLWVSTRVLFSVKLKWHGQNVLDKQTSNLTCSLIPGYCWPPFQQLGLV